MPFELPPEYQDLTNETLGVPESLDAMKQAAAPKPAAAPETPKEQPQKLGPYADQPLEGLQKFVEENIAIPLVDFFDTSRNAEEVANDRATARSVNKEKAQALDDRMSQDTSFAGETIRALAGSTEDLVEGLVNLPGDAASLIPGVPKDFLDVDFNFIRENNTQVGQAVRTLLRYYKAARIGGSLTGGRLTAGQTGGALFAGRAGQGFIEDFLGADGTGEDQTLIGMTPFTHALQTSDKNNPILNRTLVGLEGALISGTAGAAADWIKPLKRWGQFKQSSTYRKLFPAFKVDPQASQKARLAHDRLNQMIGQLYADDQYGKTLDYTRKVEADYAVRLIEDQRRPYLQFIDEAAGGDADVAKYLKLRTEALAAAKKSDEVYNTIKYGGDPDEEVIDGLAFPALQKVLDDVDSDIKTLEGTASDLDTQIKELSSDLTTQSTVSGRSLGQIQDLQLRSMDAPRLADVKAEKLAIPLSLSAYQVKYLKALKLPRGVTITPGRRVKGLTSENIDELIGIVESGPDGTVKTNLLNRIPNVERPPELDPNIDTIEGLNAQVKGLQDQVTQADEAAVANRQQLQPLFAEQARNRQQLAELKLKREALYSRFNGQGETFKSKAEKMKADPGDLVPETIERVVKEAEETIQPMTRKAAMQMGKEADQLIPTRPRASIAAPQPSQSYVNTANPIKSQLTDADVRTLSRDSEEFLKLKEIAGMTGKFPGRTDAEIIDRMQSELTQDLFEQLKQAEGDDIIDLVKQDPRMGSLLNDGSGIWFASIEGREALNRTVGALQVDIKQLSQTLFNQMKDGTPEIGMNMERLNERFLAVYNLIKSDSAARGSALREIKVIADNSGQKLTPGQNSLLDELAERNNDILARQEATYNALLGLGDEIRTNPKSAARKLSRAIDVLAMSHSTAGTQINVIRSLTAASLKNADGLYINSILSGPATQARNFWGNFYQATGHPLLAYFGTMLPGKSNDLVRRQAVASFGATYETLKEFTDLVPRIWNANVKGLDFDSPNYQVWDEGLTKNIAQIQQMDIDGKLNFVERSTLGLAIAFRKVLLSPMFSFMMRTMGSVDSFFKVIAGRQTIAKRAVEDALEAMGDRPLTGKAAEEFGELVEKLKKRHELDIFAEDKLTLIDPEAEELARTFTFQVQAGKTDGVTAKLNELASMPGARLLGLTFIKTPSQILKGTLGLTPGVSTLMKRLDAEYKTGTPYYRAMRDGQEAMSYLLASTAFGMGLAGGMTGAGPLDAQKNKQWRAAGNKPFNVRLPFGFEVNYQGLEPATSMLGMASDLGQMTAGRQEFDVLSVVGANLINKSFLTQFASAAEILTVTEEGKGRKVVENITRGLIPFSGMRSQVGGLFDQYIRETRAKLDQHVSWTKKATGLGPELPKRLDPITGKPLTKEGFTNEQGGFFLSLTNMASPLGLRFSMERSKPIHKELFNWGVRLDPETKDVEGVELTNDEMQEYIRLRADGGKLEQSLLDYKNSKRYKEVDKPQSELMLKEGYEEKDTPVHQAYSDIIAAFGRTARAQMDLGLTEASAGFSKRLNEKRLKEANTGQRYSTSLQRLY